MTKMKTFWQNTLMPIGYLRHFLPYLRQYRLKLFLITVISVIMSIVPLVFPHLFRVIIDVAYPARNLQLFWKISLLIVVLSIIMTAIRGCAEYLATRMNYNIRCRIQIHIFKIMSHLQISHLEKTGPSELIERMSFDSREIAKILIAMFPEVISIPILFVVTLLLMTRINAIITLLVLVIIPLYLFITLIATSILRKLQQKLLKQVELVKNVIDESFHGIEVLRFFSFQKKRQQKRYDNALKDKVKLEMAIWRQSFIYRQLSEMLTTGWGFILTLGGLFLMFKGRLQVGEAMALGMYVVILMRPFRKALSLYEIMMSASISAQRIVELDQYQLPSSSQLAITLPDIHKGIDIRNVSFSYDSNKVALQNISLYVPSGNTLAIIGANGSGKTTLLKLIANYYTQYTGKISFNDKELQKIRNIDYLEYIAMVWAQNHFFDGTIMENCRSDGEVNDDEIRNIANILGFDKWINKLESGYDSTLGNNGIKLSSGESQKIAILRALAKKSSILLIDELSSCLDIESEHALLKGLNTLRPQDSITVLVTHKLDVTMQPWINQVAVLSEGALVQYGQPKQLLKEKGFYSYYLGLGREFRKSDNVNV